MNIGLKDHGKVKWYGVRYEDGTEKWINKGFYDKLLKRTLKEYFFMKDFPSDVFEKLKNLKRGK